MYVIDVELTNRCCWVYILDGICFLIISCVSSRLRPVNVHFRHVLHPIRYLLPPACSSFSQHQNL